MITTVTDDPWEWHKFWHEVDDNGEPYMTPSESYSPSKSSTSVRPTEPQDDEHSRTDSHSTQ